MQDAWRAYLELALGATEASRKQAQKVAKKLVGKGGVKASQIQTMAEDLYAASTTNREALTKLVRFEVDRALGVVGLATADEVAELTRKVRELETELNAARAQPATAATPTTAATPATPATPTAATRTVAKKTVAKKAPAKKAPAGKAAPAAAIADSVAAPAPLATPATTDTKPGDTAAAKAPAKAAAKAAAAKSAPARKAPAKKVAATKAAKKVTGTA